MAAVRGLSDEEFFGTAPLTPQLQMPNYTPPMGGRGQFTNYASAPASTGFSDEDFLGSPQPKDIGLWERAKANFAHEAFTGTNEAVLRNEEDARVRRLNEWGYTDAAKKILDERAANDARDRNAYAGISGWNEGSLKDRLMKGTAAAAGAFGGMTTNIPTMPAYAINEIPGLGWAAKAGAGWLAERGVPFLGRFADEALTAAAPRAADLFERATGVARPGTAATERVAAAAPVEAVSPARAGRSIKPDLFARDVGMNRAGTLAESAARPTTKQMLTEAARQGGHQAVVQTVTNPIEQAEKVSTGLQDAFDPLALALAPLTGFGFGGALHLTAEAPSLFGNLLSKMRRERVAKGIPPDAPVTNEELVVAQAQPEFQALRAQQGPPTQEQAATMFTPPTREQFMQGRPQQGPQTREQYALGRGPEFGPPTQDMAPVRIGGVEGPPTQARAERVYGPQEGPPTAEQAAMLARPDQGPPTLADFLFGREDQGPPTLRQSGTGPVEGPPTRADALGKPGWTSAVDDLGRPVVPGRNVGEVLASLPERPLDPMGPLTREEFMAGRDVQGPPQKPFELAPVQPEVGARMGREELGPPQRDAGTPYAERAGPPSREQAGLTREFGPQSREQFIAGRPEQGPPSREQAGLTREFGPPTREATVQARGDKAQGPPTAETARQARIAEEAAAGVKTAGPITKAQHDEMVAAANQRHADRLAQIKAEADAALQRELDEIEQGARATAEARTRAPEEPAPKAEPKAEPQAARPEQGPPRGVQNEQHFEAQQRAHDAGTEPAAEDLPPPVRAEHAEPAPQPAQRTRTEALKTEPDPSLTRELDDMEAARQRRLKGLPPERTEPAPRPVTTTPPREIAAGGGEHAAAVGPTPGADTSPHAPTTDMAFEAKQREWDSAQRAIDNAAMAHDALTAEDKNAWHQSEGEGQPQGGAAEQAGGRQGEPADIAAREGTAGDNARTESQPSAVDRETGGVEHGGSESVEGTGERAASERVSEPADRPEGAEPGERQSKAAVKKEKASAATQLKFTFSSNPIGSAALWKDLFDTVTKVFKWDEPSANRWVQTLKDNVNLAAKELKAGKYGGVWEMMRRHFYTEDGELRTVAAQHASKIIKGIADKFFVPARFGAEATGEDYFQAIFNRQREWGNRLGKVLEPWRGESDAVKEDIGRQITRLVQNPDQLKAKAGTDIGKAAAQVQKVLAEVHKYMVDAGVDIGHVPEGYFPRVENTEAILKDPEKFLVQAEKAYRASGVPPAEAKEAAEAWLARVRLGDWGTREQERNSFALFDQSRTLSKAADSIMGDFLLQNPGDVLPAYLRRATKKAEWSRRFGKRDAGAVPPSSLHGVEISKWRDDPQGKWKDAMAELRKEGNGHLEQKVTEIVRGITGDYGSVGGAQGVGNRVAQMARTFVALSHMSKAVLTSLTEPIINAVQTGNTKDILTAYGETIRQWVPILRKQGDGSYLREFGEDAGYIGDGIDSTTMMQRMGGDNESLFLRRVTDSYFRSTGLTQFTEATRVASIKIGMRFMRRLAKDIESDGTYARIARRLFAEMGVGKETIKGSHADPVLEFSKWLSGLDKPTVGELRGQGEFGKLYETALGRFVNRSVQHPTGALRPHLANQHPLGSLVYGLQSFNFAFQKNVLSRVGAGIKTAVHGGKEGLNAQERAYALMPLANMGALVAMAYTISEVRDAMFNDPARAGLPDLTGRKKWMRAASRAGLTGSFDPLFNFATQSKWQGTLVDAVAGPALGDVARIVGSTTDFAGQPFAEKESETNTIDRKFATDAYNLGVQPALVGSIMSGLPVIGIGGRVVGAAAAYGLAHPEARAKFVNTLAGEKEPAP